MEFDIRIKVKENYILAKLGGEIDVYSAPRLKEALIPALQEGTPVIIDLAQVSYIDSTGFGVLVGVLKRIKEKQGTLKLAFDSERLARLFAVTDLDKIFQIFVDEESAAAHL